jgi:hypothetical protein
MKPYCNLILKGLAAVAPALLWLADVSSATGQYTPLYSKAPTEHFNPKDLMPVRPDGEVVDTLKSIRLDRVPPALTIETSRKALDKRTAAAIRATAATPLDNLGDEDYGTAILSYFAYQDYFNDPGKAYASGLLQTALSKAPRRADSTAHTKLYSPGALPIRT